MARIILVHGYTGTPEENWFPWLKEKLEAEDIETIVPQMPHSDAPKLNEWLKHLQGIVGNVDNSTYLIGHSLGCATIMRFLQALPEDQQVAGIILVAGFAEPIRFSELDEFTVPEWDNQHIKVAAHKIILINSDNDPSVPMSTAGHLYELIGGEQIIVHDAGHFNTDSGYTKFPVLLNQVNKLISV
jgi:predicted alpha/beta hydrolase family esterase